MRKVLFSLLFACTYIYNASAQSSRDTIHVYFDLAAQTLGAQEMNKLDIYAYHGNLPVNKQYGIIGYADYVGDSISNQTLSESRADNVKDYLLGLGVSPDSIQVVIGKGSIKRDTKNGNEGYKEDRRVDIIIGGIPQQKKPSQSKVIKIVDNTKKPPLATQPPAIKTDSASTPVKKIDITNVAQNSTLVLENLYFVPGSHIILTESIPQLMELVRTMDDNPKLKIQIEGHICCSMNVTDGYDYDAKDNNLSLNRAKYIYDYLVEYGINKNRLSYKGFGFSQPLVYPEKNDDDENKNRRVEIRIIKK